LIIDDDGGVDAAKPEVRFASGEYETEVNPEWFE
jgi:hypothetical protein